MPKEHRLKIRKDTMPINVPLNFLLGCSETSLGDYELARHARVADLRRQIFELFDQLTQEMGQVSLAAWFRKNDRAAINRALAIEESPAAWAARTISERGRSAEELLPTPSLPPGAAHLAASVRYAERNVAEGKCSVCPTPLAENSVRFCVKHLTAARMRHKPQGGDDPGSIDYLYQDHTPEKRHGRQPGTLKALATANEQKQRAVLAELGIPPESAAITLDAVKNALMEHMPKTKSSALQASKLFDVAAIPSISTGQKALLELFSAGKIQRFGEGNCGSPFRYFINGEAKRFTE
jgi:hypothetical protein